MKFESFCIAAAFLVILAAGAAVHAQSDDPHAILDKGVKATGLTSPALTGADIPAWHLKANYSVYDPAKGSVTESGVFEEWYTSPYTWHRVYTEKKQTASEWSTGHVKQFKAKEGKLDLVKLDQVVARHDDGWRGEKRKRNETSRLASLSLWSLRFSAQMTRRETCVEHRVSAFCGLIALRRPCEMDARYVRCWQHIEPPRDCRRLQLLRRWEP